MWKSDLIGLDGNENVNGATELWFWYILFYIVTRRMSPDDKSDQWDEIFHWILNRRERMKFLGIEFYFMGEKFSRISFDFWLYQQTKQHWISMLMLLANARAEIYKIISRDKAAKWKIFSWRGQSKVESCNRSGMIYCCFQAFLNFKLWLKPTKETVAK